MTYFAASKYKRSSITTHSYLNVITGGLAFDSGGLAFGATLRQPLVITTPRPQTTVTTGGIASGAPSSIRGSTLVGLHLLQRGVNTSRCFWYDSGGPAPPNELRYIYGSVVKSDLVGLRSVLYSCSRN